MEYIPQRSDWDCGVATLAMLSDSTYEQIESVFPRDANPYGLTDYQIEKYMVEHCGYEVILMGTFPSPNADKIYFVGRCYKNSPLHSVAMDSNWAVYDPGRPEVKKINEYHQILGFISFKKLC